MMRSNISQVILLGSFAMLTSNIAQAQFPLVPGPRGIVAAPCPPPLSPPAELASAIRNPQQPPPPGVAKFLHEMDMRAQVDWANLCRYEADNAALKTAGGPRPAAVFLGDSITEGWVRADTSFFASNNVVGRGISGQVSGQALLRFRQDVVDLHPKVVQILIGTNDVAGNAGPTAYVDIERNLTSMVQLARANKIRIILGTVPPASDFPWRSGMLPAKKIEHLNDWIRDYARRENIAVADYHAALANAEGGFRPDWTSDGVHPNVAGYGAMEPIALAAIASALSKSR